MPIDDKTAAIGDAVATTWAGEKLTPNESILMVQAVAGIQKGAQNLDEMVGYDKRITASALLTVALSRAIDLDGSEAVAGALRALADELAKVRQ